MTDGAKVLAGFIGVICGIIAFVMWTDDRPSDQAWWTMVGFATATVVCIGLCCIPRPADKAPDYLFELISDRPLDKDELCFSFTSTVREGVWYLQLWFQNQRDAACEAVIGLSAREEIFGGDRRSVAFKIDCPGGGFGVAAVPLPAPQQFYGSAMTFQVGATVERASGWGKRVRFRQGMHISTEATFGSGFETGLQIAGLFAGAIVTKSRTTLTLDVPVDVQQSLPQDDDPTVTVLWEMGQPPLETEGFTDHLTA